MLLSFWLCISRGFYNRRTCRDSLRARLLRSHCCFVCWSAFMLSGLLCLFCIICLSFVLGFACAYI